jgi:hypothetical protein
VKYQKRPPLTSREIQILILIGFVTVAVLGTLIGADIRMSKGLPGGGGFFAPWNAARLFIYEHAAPYGGEPQRLAETTVYGHAAGSGEKPYPVTIPFFMLLTYFPLAAFSDPLPQQGIGSVLNSFSDPATARGIWIFLNEATLVATAFLAVKLIEWQPGRIFYIAYALLAVFGLYSVMALIEGGPAILLGLLYAAILYAYSRGQYELAGTLLVLTLFAWEIGFLFVALALWKVFQEKRWRVLAGFVMIFLILMVVSLLIYPGWIFPFVISTLATLRTSFGTTTSAVLMRLSPSYGKHASQAMTVLLAILLLYEWAATRGGDERRFIWAACLTLAVTPLIGLRTEPGNLAVLVPSLAMIFAATASRWRGGYWLASLLFLVALLVPWGFFVRWYWLHEQRAFDYLFLFGPLFTVAGLYWTRWWFIRPPRTWFDHVRSTLGSDRRLADSRHSPGSTG